MHGTYFLERPFQSNHDSIANFRVQFEKDCVMQLHLHANWTWKKRQFKQHKPYTEVLLQSVNNPICLSSSSVSQEKELGQ